MQRSLGVRMGLISRASRSTSRWPAPGVRVGVCVWVVGRGGVVLAQFRDASVIVLGKLRAFLGYPPPGGGGGAGPYG